MSDTRCPKHGSSFLLENNYGRTVCAMCKIAAPSDTPVAPHKPAMVFSPAEMLAEEAMARGWSRTKVAARMGGDRKVNLASLTFLGLQKPDILIGDDGAKKLEEAFGISAGFWLNLETMWRANPDAQTPFAMDSPHAQWFGLNDPA